MPPTARLRASLLAAPALQHIDGINLFALISIASLLYCLPLALLMESHVWAGAYEAAAAKLTASGFVQQMVLGGIFYHLYNQASRLVVGPREARERPAGLGGRKKGPLACSRCCCLLLVCAV